MKILISMPEEMVKDIQEICLRENYERSEFIRTCIREKVYPRDIPTLPDLVEKGLPKQPIKEEKHDDRLEKAKKVLEGITKKVPMFCPKHGSQRVGESYSCGCQL